MSRSALARSVAILLEEEQEESTALVELHFALVVSNVDTSGPEPKYFEGAAAADEELIRVGGVWDRRRKRWSDQEPKSVVLLRIPRGSEQEPAARWAAEWLKRRAAGRRGVHWDDFRRVWTWLLEGGRAGGKSFMAVDLVALYMAMMPRALCWAISPTQEETDELEQAFREAVPSHLFTFRGGGAGKPLQFRMANGSRLLCLSGHKPRSLKRGRVDIALYNEGQNMSRAGWIQLRGAAARTGGLVVIAANPPDAEIGRWIEELHERGRAEKIKVQVHKMTAATMPFVEVKALEDMAEENDELTYRREVLGEFVPIGDVVFHAWSDAESVIGEPDPRWTDVTREETKRELGREFDYIVGEDYQATPHMVGVIMKLYRDGAGDLVVVIVDEVVVENADENDLVDALEGKRLDVMPGRWTANGRELGVGYDPEACGQVVDATGITTQDGAHSKPQRTSQDWLRARGWRWVYFPDRASKKNPDIVERCKVTNARLKNAAGKRRMFTLRHCVRTIKAMRAWENRGGAPYRKSPFAHVCDGVSYPVYRFFAHQRKVTNGGGFTQVKRFGRRDEFAALGDVDGD